MTCHSDCRIIETHFTAFELNPPVVHFHGDREALRDKAFSRAFVAMVRAAYNVTVDKLKVLVLLVLFASCTDKGIDFVEPTIDGYWTITKEQTCRWNNPYFCEETFIEYERAFMFFESLDSAEIYYLQAVRPMDIKIDGDMIYVLVPPNHNLPPLAEYRYEIFDSILTLEGGFYNSKFKRFELQKVYK